MIKITDQYLWNFIFLVFLGFLIVMATIILDTESRMALTDLGPLDALLIILSSWRLMRLISTDTSTKFFREQFYELRKTVKSYSLKVPEAGPQRTILEIILSPASLSLGIVFVVTFVYLLTSYAVYPLLLLAFSGLIMFFEEGFKLLTEKTEREVREKE